MMTLSQAVYTTAVSAEFREQLQAGVFETLSDLLSAEEREALLSVRQWLALPPRVLAALAHAAVESTWDGYSEPRPQQA